MPGKDFSDRTKHIHQVKIMKFQLSQTCVCMCVCCMHLLDVHVYLCVQEHVKERGQCWAYSLSILLFWAWSLTESQADISSIYLASKPQESSFLSPSTGITKYISEMPGLSCIY